MIETTFEDTHLLLVVKKAGIPVAPDKTGDPNLLDLLQEQTGLSLHPVHRIDRPVSGLVLFAKTAEAMTAMTQLWQQKKVQKTYLAVVAKAESLEAATLVHFMDKNPKNNKVKVSADKRPNTEQATLHYRVLGHSDRYTLLEVSPETGRRHQIRAQLAAIGHPIKGDVKYGARRANADRSIHLHAWKLAFAHPFSGRQMAAETPPPDEPLWNALLRNP